MIRLSALIALIPFAQNPAPTVSMTEFSLQLIVQCGALGLLAIIVYQLPKAIKEIREWRDTTEASHRVERDSLKAERDNLLTAYREEARYERESCKQHFDKLAEISVQNQQTTHQALSELGEAVKGVNRSSQAQEFVARGVAQVADSIHEISKRPPAGG